jgi:hypothetical protein
LKHGKGKETYSDGRVFVGSFVKGGKEGTGTLYSDGSDFVIYEGGWKDNVYHGEGILNNSDSKYEGGFVAGEFSEIGCLTLKIKTIECEWRRGRIVDGANATVKWEDGSAYTGAVDNEGIPNCLIGGVCKFKKGDVYSGGWLNGCREGEGTCVFINKEVYEGGWKDDSFFGRGTLTLADLTVHRFDVD